MNRTSGPSKVQLYVAGALICALAALLVVVNLRESEPEAQNLSSPSGEILVAGEVQATGPGEDVARQIGTVFVILKDASGGPPYAVTRLENKGASIVPFELSEAHVMIPGRPRPAAPLLKIRFDSDADASTESPGDLIGEVQGFSLGARDLRVTAELLTRIQ